MNYQDIFVDRIGKTPGSFMRTNKLVQVLQPDTLLKVEKNQLAVQKPGDILKNKFNLDDNDSIYFDHDVNFVKIKGKFIKSFLAEKTSNNILGKNDFFITDCEFITIPETKTTQETLETFGCKLIKSEEIFSFNYKQELPLFEVSIGPDYVQEYLLQPGYGNGFYIEKHNTPHYHQPLDVNSCGFLILGLIVDDDLILTKFKIPYGYGVYMEPETLHSDAFLVGNYNVVYTKTSDYSTYLFVNPNNSIVHVE